MRSILLILSSVLLASCARDAPPPPEVAAEIQAFDAALANARKSLAIQNVTGLRKDFRDRTIEQDLAQWVFTKTVLDRVDEIKQRAAKTKSSAEAEPVLAEARALVTAELARVQPILGYWSDHAPAPYWRTYWNDLFTINQVAVKDPDPLLVSIETRAKATLDRGDFVEAGKIVDEISPVLVAALDRTAGSLVNEVPPPKFLTRITKCIPGAPPNRSRRKPKMTDAKSVNEFYPAEAIQRGETGTIVVRARVAASGCASHVALVVQSGVRSLDAAALKWFETAQFSPGSENGRAIESDLTFKLKFVLEDDSAG
ncbi:MAG: energy transducer TonB [Steroidobacteraceae bacterium]|nr:energy transducer TonB [Steroidobacteraceae bacterium]